MGDYRPEGYNTDPRYTRLEETSRSWRRLVEPCEGGQDPERALAPCVGGRILLDRRTRMYAVT